MRRCTGKCGLITICLIQLLATIERQAFDFLGYMWLPIIANFLQMVAAIFGFFGAYQHRVRYLGLYTAWSVIWLGWNIFVLCFYMEVGSLRRSNELLSLYTGAASFWEASGPGCVPVYASNGTVLEDPYRQPRPQRVDGCWLEFQHVETLHAGVHIVLTVIGVTLALCLIIARRREDDSSGVKPRPLSPAYHIEYRPHRVEDRPVSPAPSPAPLAEGGQELGAVGPAPMTPRKIKRRAMTRGSQRSSGRSSRSGRSRSSQRHRRHANPVTQLIDSSSSEYPERGHTNPGYLPSDPPRPPSVHSSYSNYHGQRRTHGVGGVTSGVTGGVTGAVGGAVGGASGAFSAHNPGPSSIGGHSAVASDYGTTGTLSTSGYGRRPAAQVPGTARYGTEYGQEYGTGYGTEYGRAGPPPYEAVPGHTETSM